MKKLTTSKIAMRNLQRYKVRTSVMVIFTMLIVGMTFTSSILLKSMKSSIDNTINRVGADIIVVPSQYEDDLKDSLFLGEPCSFYFDKSYMDNIDKIDGIKSISPQLYITSLASDCCSSEVQIIAYDPSTDFIIKPWADEINTKTLDDDCILIGASIEGNIGDTITFFNKDFTIAGKLSKTDTSYDESAFINFDAAKELLADDILNQITNIKDFDEVVSSLMIRTYDDANIKEISRTINYSLENSPIKSYTMNGMFQNISDKMNDLQLYSNMMIILLILVSIIALICIFTITINERKHEFGVLASLGAKKSHIINIIIFEAGTIGLIGGLLGTISSTILLYLFKNIIFQKLGILYFYYDSLYILKIGILCIITGLIITLLSASYTVISVSKTDLINMIKEEV